MTRYILVKNQDGFKIKCKVIESLGYNHDICSRVTVVEHDGQERKAVGGGRYGWRFWTAADRTRPLIEELERRAKVRKTEEG